MSMLPGSPCHPDANFPPPEQPEECPECKGKRFYYDRFIDGTGSLSCQACDGSGESTREKTDRLFREQQERGEV